MSIKSLDDLPDIPAENRFSFSADLAEILVSYRPMEWAHDPARCPICSAAAGLEWGY